MAAGLPAIKATEYDILTTADGTSYILHGPAGRSVLAFSGTGMPEIEYITQRGPFQHGESVKDYFLRPRVVEYHIRQVGCSRDQYWALRAALLDILRPNRGLNATLTKYRANLPPRALTVTIQQGPGFQGAKQGVWDEWSIDEILRFVAFNPVYYDPVPYAISFNALGGMTFPITFPIVFAASGGNAIIAYNGTWLEYPTFVITGPLSSIDIYNATTDERIGLTYSIAAGRVVTISLSYGAKTVTLDDGTNLIGYLTPSSDLGTFHLTPGNNDISVTGTGFVTGSAIELQYHERYIGI